MDLDTAKRVVKEAVEMIEDGDIEYYAGRPGRLDRWYRELNEAAYVLRSAGYPTVKANKAIDAIRNYSV